jgi:phenylacetate-CoA ligase
MAFASRLLNSLYAGFQLRGQFRYPFRPRARILADQSGRLRRITAYAYDNVPYYQETFRRLGLTPADIRRAEDLERLPVLERRAVQADPERFLSRAARLDRCLKLQTGGSTGAPLTYFRDVRCVLKLLGVQERYRAVLAGAVGRRLRYRETLIAPPQSSARKSIAFWWGQTVVLKWISPRKQFLSMLDPPQANIAAMDRFKPDVVHSYGSYIEVLFARLAEADRLSHRPECIGFGGDGLSDPARRSIGETFGIPAFSSYDAVEAWRLGFECGRHSGIHINEDFYALRIADEAGRTVPHGSPGDVVVSNLVNRAMILLNYRLGDLASVAPEPCPCGRNLLLLSYPSGRNDDWVELPGGRRIHPYVFHRVLREQRDVWQYQIVQETALSFLVSLIAKEACQREAAAASIARRIKEALGPDAEVAVRFVAEIPRTPGGKVRPVVSLSAGRVSGRTER